MEIILGAFVVVLVLGWLIPSPFSWAARRKLQAENRSFREHLHTQMEIDATGIAEMRKESAQLRQMNENLRITVQTLKNKPDRRELHLLQTYDRAINIMLERAPGFAQHGSASWNWLKKSMCRWTPGFAR